MTVPEAQSWQPALWRRLLQDIPAEARQSGRAQVHKKFLEACGNLDHSHRPEDLPRRVVVFGLSSLPGQTLEVLAAISRCTQVVLCVHNPCMHYWGDIVDPQQSLKQFNVPYKRQPPRRDFPVVTADANSVQLDELFMRGNPLLAAWGKQGRDYIRLLDEHDQRSAYESLFQSEKIDIDLFEEPDESSLLGQLQGDIYHLRSSDEARRFSEDSGASAYGSISFHIAHSAQREVEILQDYLLDLFNHNPHLRPRDVLVMVPDINQFAPSVQAVFGRLSRDDTRYIPFTISDQGQGRQAPLYLALAMLLQLPSARLGVSELLDFLDVPAVQNAFDISVQDKPLLHRWIEQAGIRWGINAEHRESLGMPADLDSQVLEQNTWHFGLRRMLLGYAIGRGDRQQAQCWQGIEAFDEIGGLSAALAGKLAHLLRQLEDSRALLRNPAPVAEWTQRLSVMLSQFFVAETESDLVLITRVEKMLADWRSASASAEFDDELSIDVVREFVLEQLEQQTLTQRFLAGSVNFATLMPMRAIPFKHICLLGMNDGDYPRQVPSVDFDLMRHDYRPGDRSRRDDDRYLFLEALLSARDSLYISWSGRSIRDNSERPPSVLVAQLRDYLAETRGKTIVAAMTQEYPLQPFSRRYFDVDSGLSTYAGEWYPAMPAVAPVREAGHIKRKSETHDISLSDLEKLLRVPADVFFEHSLGVNFSTEQVTTEDHEAFSLDALARWSIQQQLISDAVSQPDQTEPVENLLLRLMSRQLRRGVLPVPPFADIPVRQTVQRLIKPLQRYREILSSHSSKLTLSVNLMSGDNMVQLSDQLNDIWQMPDSPRQRVRCVLFNSQLWAGNDGKKASVKWHYLARVWPAHLAAQADGPVTTYLLGPDTQEVLAPLDRDEASTLLKALINLWQKNLQAPLAACVKTSCAMLTAPDHKSRDTVAQETYHGAYMSTGEVQQHYSLYRLWPQFDALYQDGFTEHSNQLYGALTEHWLRHRRLATSGEKR